MLLSVLPGTHHTYVLHTTRITCSAAVARVVFTTKLEGCAAVRDGSAIKQFSSCRRFRNCVEILEF